MFLWHFVVSCVFVTELSGAYLLWNLLPSSALLMQVVEWLVISLQVITVSNDQK